MLSNKLFLLPFLNMIRSYEAFSSLNPCKAVGMDDIGPKVLKGCAISLYKPFHYLYNLILRQPLEWCMHCIVPIFKSGDKSSVSNYRPVSLLCNSSKVLEHLIYDQIIGHVYKHLLKKMGQLSNNFSLSLMTL